MPARAVRTLFPLLFFLGWATVFTFPLVLRMGDSIVLTRGDDAWLHFSNLWWLDKALVDLHQNPYHTNYMLYPTGLSLYYHSFNVFDSLLSIPLQHLFNITAAFNLLLLANLTLDGLAAYWLCFDRTRSTGASLVGGALFAAAPLLSTSVDLAQLDEVTVWWIPLYIMALWRALDSPGPVWRAGGGRRAALAAGMCLVGASLATWYFTAGLAVFTLLFVPAYLLSTHRWVWAAGKLAAIVGLFIIALSPLLWSMIQERLSGATYMLSTAAVTRFNSADLAAIFFPPRLDSDINKHGSTVALGYVALGLGLLGLVKHWRKVWPVGLAMLGLVVMALGPELQVAGNQLGIPLPYALLNNVPFIGASRQPLRFLATAGACLALLAALGMVWLLRLERLRDWGRVALVVVLGLVVLESFPLPRTMKSTAVEPAYTFINESNAQGAVLDVPTDKWSGLTLLGQTVHDRPVLGGYRSRHFPYAFSEAAPGVAQLFGADPDPLAQDDILTPKVADTALASLDYYGVRFVVAHKRDLDTGRYGRLEDVLDFLFTQKNRAYEDSDVIAYQVPPQPPEGLPLAGLGSGWHRVEQNPLHRWTGRNVTDGNGFVWVGIPPGSEGRYRLNFTAYAYKSPRHLSVVLDGNTLLQKELGTAFEDIEVDLGALQAGDHELLLQVAEPPENPPGDERKLGIGVTRLAVTRVGE